MSARSVTLTLVPAVQPTNGSEDPEATNQWETSIRSRDKNTAEMNLILTDINMICVTDMSHKYFTLYDPNMKTFLYLEPHEI